MNGSGNITPLPGTPRRPVVLYRSSDVVITTAYAEFSGCQYPLEQLSFFYKTQQGNWLRREFQLWARLDGRFVKLFTSRDKLEFGRVGRALTRARECAGLA